MKQLPPRVLEVVELARNKPGMTRGQIAEILGCSPNTAGVHLNKAMNAGALRSSGFGRYTTWGPVTCAAKNPTPKASLNSVWAMAL